MIVAGRRGAAGRAAWIACTIEVDNAFEAFGAERVGHRFRVSLPMWTNGLRLIDEDGATVADLRACLNRGASERSWSTRSSYGLVAGAHGLLSERRGR